MGEDRKGRETRVSEVSGKQEAEYIVYMCETVKNKNLINEKEDCE